MSEVTDKAIRIAMGTFLSDWKGDAVEVWKRINEEEDFESVDYVTVWEPFECEPFSVVYDNIECLINQIVDSFDC